MADPRKIWLCIDDGGIVQRATWAAAATPAEIGSVQFPDRQAGLSAEEKIAWACALTQAEVDAGWTATLTNWKGAPEVIESGICTITSRELTGTGAKWNLDDLDPYQAEITTEADLVASAEALGKPIAFTERTTGKRVFVYNEARPETPNDADYAIVLHRVGGTPTRVDQ